MTDTTPTGPPRGQPRSIRLPGWLWEYTDRSAAEAGTTRTAVIEQALREHLAPPDTLEAMAGVPEPEFGADAEQFRRGFKAGHCASRAWCAMVWTLGEDDTKPGDDAQCPVCHQYHAVHQDDVWVITFAAPQADVCRPVCRMCTPCTPGE
jgi:hypothetical protein